MGPSQIWTVTDFDPEPLNRVVKVVPAPLEGLPSGALHTQDIALPLYVAVQNTSCSISTVVGVQLIEVTRGTVPTTVTVRLVFVQAEPLHTLSDTV